jgi:hypothetical protein
MLALFEVVLEMSRAGETPAKVLNSCVNYKMVHLLFFCFCCGSLRGLRTALAKNS